MFQSGIPLLNSSNICTAKQQWLPMLVASVLIISPSSAVKQGPRFHCGSFHFWCIFCVQLKHVSFLQFRGKQKKNCLLLFVLTHNLKNILFLIVLTFSALCCEVGDKWATQTEMSKQTKPSLSLWQTFTSFSENMYFGLFWGSFEREERRGFCSTSYEIFVCCKGCQKNLRAW